VDAGNPGEPRSKLPSHGMENSLARFKRTSGAVELRRSARRTGSMKDSKVCDRASIIATPSLSNSVSFSSASFASSAVSASVAR
jgi:hypothetical protein